MQEAQAKSNGLSSVQEEFQELKDQMGSIGGTADIDGKKYLIDFVIICVYFAMFITKLNPHNFFPHSSVTAGLFSTTE